MTKIFSNAHEIEWSQRENGHNIKDFICSYYLYIKFYTASRVLTRNQLPTICNEFQFNLHVIVVQCTYYSIMYKLCSEITYFNVCIPSLYVGMCRNVDRTISIFFMVVLQGMFHMTEPSVCDI